MALPTYREVLSDPEFQSADVARQTVINDAYWKAYGEEAPDDGWGVEMKNTSSKALEIKSKLADASPLEQRSLGYEREVLNTKLSLGVNLKEGAFKTTKEFTDATAAENFRLAGERSKLGKTFSLLDPEVDKQMQPAWEALGKSALDEGVFGEKTLSPIAKTGRYNTLRTELSNTFHLAPEEVDDVVKHRMGLQADPVSRDAFGQIHIKPEILAKPAADIQKAIESSKLPQSVKDREIPLIADKIAGFRSGFVENVMKNQPEVAAYAGMSPEMTPDQNFTLLTDRLIENKGYQAATGAVSGLQDSTAGLAHIAGLFQEKFTGGAVPSMEKVSRDIKERAKTNQQLTDLSYVLNKEATTLFGTNAAVIGKGVESVAESVVIAGATAPLAPQFVLAKLAGSGKVGNYVVQGLNAMSRVSPTAGVFGARQGVDTYEQAKKAGMSDEDALNFGLQSGAIETFTTMLFSGLHLGGVEDIATGAARQRIAAEVVSKIRSVPWAATKGAFASVSGELLEENTITALDSVLTQAKLNPNMTESDIKQALYDTTVATLVAGGAFAAKAGFDEASQIKINNTATANQTTEQLEEQADAIRFENLAEENLPEAETKGGAVTPPSPERVAELQSRKAEVLADLKLVPIEGPAHNKLLDELAEIEDEQNQQSPTGEPNAPQAPVEVVDPTQDIKYTRDGPKGSLVEGLDFIADTSESTVYRDGDTVLKISEPYNDNSEETYQARISNRKLIDSELGDGTLEQDGHYLSDNGTKNPIFRQKFYSGREASTQEIDDHMESRGYTKQEDGTYTKEKDGKTFKATDLEDGNVIVDSQGTTHVIDANLSETTVSETSIAPTEQPSAQTTPAAPPIEQKPAPDLVAVTDAVLGALGITREEAAGITGETLSQEGEGMVGHAGTAGDFDTLRPSDDGFLGKGVYVAVGENSEMVADIYAQRAQQRNNKGKRIISLKIQVKNTLDFSKITNEQSKKLLDLIPKTKEQWVIALKQAGFGKDAEGVAAEQMETWRNGYRTLQQAMRVVANGGIVDALTIYNILVEGQLVQNLYKKAGYDSVMTESRVNVRGDSVLQTEMNVFDPENVTSLTDTLSQDSPSEPNAKVTFSGLASALITYYKNANGSSAVHEPIHIARRFLLNRDIPADKRTGITDEMIDAANEFVGATSSSWTVAQEEKFARAFERYLWEGVETGVPKVDSLFEQIKKFMRDVYKNIKGSSLDVELTPEIKSLFDKLITRGETLKAEGKAPTPIKIEVKVAKPVDTPKPKPVSIAADTPEQLGIRKALLKSQAEAFGVNAPNRRVSMSDQEAIEIAESRIANPEARTGSDLVEYLLSHPEQTTDKVQQALLAHEMVKRSNRVDQLRERAKKEGGSSGDRAVAASALREAYDKLEEILDVIRFQGSKAGLALQAMKLVTNRKFELEQMLGDAQVWANDGSTARVSLTDEQRQLVQDMHDKIKALQEENEDLSRELDTAVKKAEEDAILAAQARAVKQVKAVKADERVRILKEKLPVSDALSRLKARGNLFGGSLSQEGERQEFKFSEEDTGAYHYGDGGVARDTTLSNMDGGRSTGHFGTGVYFLGEQRPLARADRPLRFVDLEGLNMAKPIDPKKLHDGLKLFNREVMGNRVLQFSQGNNAGSRITFGVWIALVNPKLPESKIETAMRKVQSTFANEQDDGIRTPSTYLMQELGYDGIDVRGTNLDNGDYGSVVFTKGNTDNNNQDSEYLAAIEAGDIETAQRMVDEAAKKAGYTIKAYHGTDAQFDAFDPSTIGRRFNADKKGFFFAIKKGDSYKGGRTISAYIKPGKVFTNKDLENSGVEPIADGDYADTDEYVDSNKKSIVDGMDAVEADTAIITDEPGFSGKMPSSYHRGTVIVFNPNQIKSADPITRDENGNVIPLSQRFNPESNSILFQDPEGLSPEVLDDLATVGASFILDGNNTEAKFADALAKEFGEDSRPFAAEIFERSKAKLDKTRKNAKVKKTPSEIKAEIDPTKPISNKMIFNMVRGYLEEGVPKEKVLALVHKDLQETWPKVTFDEVSDAYTGYGKAKYPDQEELSRQIRELRNIERIKRQIRVVESGQAPKKTGQQRDPATDRVRELEQELKAAFKRAGIKDTSSNQLKSALGAIKTRFRNQLRDFRRALDTHTKLPENKKGVDYDEEAKRLKAAVDKLRDEYTKTFEDKNLTEKQRIQRAVTTLDRLIAEEQGMLAKGILSKPRQPKAIFTDPVVKAKQAQLEKLRAARRTALAALNPRKSKSTLALEAALRENKKGLERDKQTVGTGILPVPKSRPRTFTPTQELTDILNERQTLKDIIKRLRGQKSRLERLSKADALREQRAVEAAEKSLEKIEQRIADIAAGKPAPAKNAPKPTTLAVTLARALRDSRRDTLRKLEAALKVTKTQDELREDRLVKAAENRIKKYQLRLKNKDFAAKPKLPELITKRLADVRFREAQAKADWLKARADFMLENAPWYRKTFRITRGLLQLRKLISLGGDIGAILRQMGVVTYRNVFHPRVMATVFGKAFKAGFTLDEKNEYEIYEAISTAPEAAMYKQMGMIFHNPFDEAYGNKEDIPDPEFLNVIRNAPAWKSLFIGKGLAQVLGAAERFQRAYLNQGRYEFMKSLVDSMGGMENLTPEQMALIGNAVMMGTGRWSGKRNNDFENKLEQAIPLLNSTFFISARYSLSRLAVAAGQPVWSSKGGAITENLALRRKIALEIYGKSVIGRAIFMTLIKMGYDAATGDDDDEERWRGVFNPRDKANFMKVKVGKTRIDMSSGIGPYLSELKLLVDAAGGNAVKVDRETGKVTTMKSREIADELINFQLNRSNINAAWVARTFFTKEYYGGKPATVENAIKELVLPIMINDTQKLYEEHGAEGLAIWAQMMLGDGVQPAGGFKKKEGTNSYGFKY